MYRRIKMEEKKNATIKNTQNEEHWLCMCVKLLEKSFTFPLLLEAFLLRNSGWRMGAGVSTSTHYAVCNNCRRCSEERNHYDLVKMKIISNIKLRH